MAVGITIKLKGDKELIKLLDKMSGSAQQRFVKPGIVASLKPMEAAAIAGAPYDSGALRESITTRVIPEPGKSYKHAVAGIVGPASKFTKQVKGEHFARRPSKYLHLVERGTSTTTANPFMKKAFSSTKGKALSLFRQKMAQKLIAFVKRNRGKR